jgi:hypothetical protein
VRLPGVLDRLDDAFRGAVMLQGAFTSVLQAGNRDELRDEIVRFANELGFETVSATTVVDHMLGDTEFFSIDNAPEEIGRAHV